MQGKSPDKRKLFGKTPVKREHFFPLLGLLLVFGLLLTLNAGCGNTEAAAKAAGTHDEDKILIHGLQSEDFRISVSDLKKLAAVTQYAESNRANGEKVKVEATGPLLDTFLQAYGKTQRDFTTIRFSANDNYSIAVPSDVLQKRKIILAYADYGKALSEEDQPIRVIIPEERSMYWVRMLNRIDFETGSTAASVKVVFLETAAANLPQVDYAYYGSMDKAVKTEDLVAKYADLTDDSVTSVYLKASDGLVKDETKANFLSAFIKINGQEAPKFVAPQFPQGMQIRDLVFIHYGATAFFDYTQGCKVLPARTAGSQTGVGFSDILKQSGMRETETYKFTGSGGSVELGIKDLEQGLIYQDGQGKIMFAGGKNGQTLVKDLLAIEPVR
jgi:hypothetical protein